MANKQSYHHRHVNIRGKRGSDDPMALIIEYLESLPYEYDVQKNCQVLFISQHLTIALRKHGHSEDDVKALAHEAIAYFQGHINSLKEAAGIKDDDLPEPNSVTLEGLALASAASNGNGKRRPNDSSVTEAEAKPASASRGMSEAKSILGVG